MDCETLLEAIKAEQVKTNQLLKELVEAIKGSSNG